MTLQFRSRIKSTFDYGTDIKQVGKCCFSDGTSENITFHECFSRSGIFLTDLDAPCPTSATKGYCCACAYLTTEQKAEVVNNLPYDSGDQFFRSNSFGIQPNITECECTRIGGQWNETNNSVTLCQKSVTINSEETTIDVRIPNACCSLTIQNGSAIGVTCQHVCSPRECANLAIIDTSGEDTFYDTTFNVNMACSKEIVVGAPIASCSSSGLTSRMISSSDAFAEDSLGPCYTLDTDTLEYSCNIKPSYLCTGYWVDPITVDADVAYCDHEYAPKNPTKTSGYLNSTSYSQAEFNALGLSVGDEFQGGIYIGNFSPKKTNATSFSRVYGALNFSSPSSTFVTTSDESAYKSWAIIVNKTYLKSPLAYTTDTISSFTTSYYDGYLNCYGDLSTTTKLQTRTLNTITGKLRNGFIDYYVPSILEMMFLAEQHKTNTSLSDVLALNDVFCSTTFLTDKYLKSFPNGENTFDSMNLLYGQSLLTGENFGKNTTFNLNRTVSFMLFRRIILT